MGQRDPHAGSRRPRDLLQEAPTRPRVSERAQPFALGVCRSTDPADTRAAALRRVGRCADISQARRSLPHRSAQDQQHHGTGSDRPANGQDTYNRRDRRGPARRGGRDRVGLLRTSVRSLHGRRGHQATIVERLSHQAARSYRPRGPQRKPYAQGCHERSAARLDHERERHVLHDRIGARGRTPIR